MGLSLVHFQKHWLLRVSTIFFSFQGGPYLYDKFSEASKSYCSNDWKDTYQNFLNGVYQNADLKGLKNQCIKSAWVTVALHQGRLLVKE